MRNLNDMSLLEGSRTGEMSMKLICQVAMEIPLILKRDYHIHPLFQIGDDNLIIFVSKLSPIGQLIQSILFG